MAKKIARKPVKVTRDTLGKGVGAIFNRDFDEKVAQNPQEVVKELANTVAMLPIEMIEVNPNQPRKEFDQEALQDLSESIKVHGLIQPITVRRLSAKEFQLISGERRLRASKIAGLKEVPAYIRIANDQEMLEMALIENIQREDLNAIEIANSYQRLKEEFDLFDKDLEERVGKKRSTISNYLGLLKLPENIRLAIKEKKISGGHGKALKGIEDISVQNALLKKAIDEELSVRALEKLVQEYKNPKVQKKSSASSALSSDYQDVQQSFRSFFGSKKVSIKLKGNNKGQIVIPFDNVEQLNQFLDLIED